MSDPAATMRRRTPSGGLIIVGLTLALSVALCLAGRIVFGSLSAALDYAAGQRLLINTVKQSVGQISLGQQRDAAFEVANFSDRPVAILGANLSCTCTFTKSLPLTVPPHEKRQILVTVRGETVGPVATRVIFLTDSLAEASLEVSVVGHVNPR